MEIPKTEEVQANQISIAQAVARIDQRLFDLQTRLIGNGQPGVIQNMQAEIDAHKKDIDGLNKKYWAFTGIIVAASHGVKGAWPYIVKLFT